MKNKYTLLAFIVGMFALCSTAFAQAGVPEGQTPTQTLINCLTPIIVPLVILGVKTAAPKIPSFLLPILAPIFGVLLEYVNHFATGQEPSILYGVALGAAGVGIREVIDQLKKITPVPPA